MRCWDSEMMIYINWIFITVISYHETIAGVGMFIICTFTKLTINKSHLGTTKCYNNLS